MIIKAGRNIAFIVAFLLPVCLAAQNYHLSVSQTSFQSRNQDYINIVVKIMNRSADSLKGSIQCVSDPAIDIISKSIIPVSLGANDSSFVSVSVFVSRKAHAEAHPIRFALTDKNNKLLTQAEAVVNVIAKQDVSLFVFTKNILLDNTLDSLSIPVQLFNAGNSTQTINVLCVYPSSLQERSFHNSTRVILPPSTDTTIYFSRIITKRIIAVNDFDINITGLYTNGNIAGGAVVHVQSARSTGNYLDKLGSDSYIDNSIQIGAQSMFTQQESYILRANGGFGVSDQSKINYNLDLTQWKNANSETMLRGTWLEYHNKNLGIRAGNISRSMDLNLFGRGAMAAFSTSTGNTFEAGYLDNNSNLLESKSFGNAGWASFMHTTKEWSSRHYAVFENNLFQNSRNFIAGNELHFADKNKRSYSFSLNGSSVAEYLHDSGKKYGFAASANMNGKIGKVTVNSNNYISTGYYAGLQKGARIFSERLYWTMSGSASGWATLEYRSNSQKSVSLTQYVMPSFSNMRAEWGYSRKIGTVSLSVAPAFTRETNNAYVFLDHPKRTHTLTSLNLITNLSVPINSFEYFSLNAENGTYFSSFDAKKRFHSRVSAYYRRGQFSLSTRWQQGSFYIGETANNFRNNRASNMLFTATPSLRKNFMRNRLRTETGVSYMYNSNFGTSYMVSEKVEFEANSKTRFYVYFNHNRFSGFSNNQLEMGVIRHIPVAKNDVKSNQLDLFAFKDLNQNGIYDASDSKAANTIIHIDNEIFVTDDQGRITYKNLPDGNIRISAPFSNGWHVPEQTVLVRKKTKVEIPLQTIGTLKGKLRFTRTDLSYEVGLDLFGIPIVATDRNGKVFRTKTTPDGKYVFYIPVGDYTVSVDGSKFPSEVEVLDNGIETKIATAGIVTIDFEIRARERRIEIRKFVSPTARPSAMNQKK